MSDFFNFLGEVWQHAKLATISFLMATLMAVLRTKAQSGRIDLVESIMCGLLAVGIWSFLDWLNIPQVVAVGVASGIGYFGTHWFGDVIKNYLTKDRGN